MPAAADRNARSGAQEALTTCFMYLARRIQRDQLNFVIRESFQDGACYRSRDLLDLGAAPHRFIHYAGNNAFYIDDWVFSRLRKKGFEPDPFELERLFFPFVDPSVLQRIESFADRRHYRRWKPLPAEQKRSILAAAHEFDKRRAHFLRFGQTDQRRLNRFPALFQELLDKSRDEIEQHFLRQEQILKPHEYKRYMYAIFDLQRFFTESYAYSMPEALDGDKLDQYFLKQICRLDSDRTFWEGMQRPDRLPDYLVRYVIMYFDYTFAAGMGMEEYINNFMNSRRRFMPPKSGRRVSMAEAATVFGISRSELNVMSRAELKKLFRTKARELHPDKGGSHEHFIELANAYQDMLRTKAGKS